MTDNKPVRNVDYCHRTDDILVAWLFNFQYAPDATYKEIRDNIRTAITGFWPCHQSMLRFLEIEYGVREFPSYIDISNAARPDGFEAHSADHISGSITDDRAIQFDQLEPILDHPNRVIMGIGGKKSAVKVHLAEGNVWIDHCEPPPDYEEHEDDAYLTHKWAYPPLEVHIATEDVEDNPHHYIEVSAYSDIYFEATGIGAKNRQMLHELLECIYQQTEPDDVELLEFFVGEEDLRDQGFVELLPENIGR